MPAVHQQPSTSPIGARVRFSPAGSILDDQLVRGPRNEGPAALFDAWYGKSITLDDLRLLLPAVWQDAERPTQNLPSGTWIEWFRMVGWTATDDRPQPAGSMQLYRGATWGRRRGMSWTPDLKVAQWFADRFIDVDGGEPAHVFQCQVPADAVLAFVEERKGEPEYVIDPRRLPPLGRPSIITPAGMAPMMRRPTPLAGDPTVAAELNELTLSALARVGDGSCGHIIRTASLCIACPEDGIRCPACAERHFDRDHTLAWRHTCDRCGNVAADMYPAVGAVLAPARDRVVTVALDGVGLCPPCARLGTVGRGGGVG